MNRFYGVENGGLVGSRANGFWPIREPGSTGEMVSGLRIGKKITARDRRKQTLAGDPREEVTTQVSEGSLTLGSTHREGVTSDWWNVCANRKVKA